jgi:uncharacterized protein (DUF488 family)
MPATPEMTWHTTRHYVVVSTRPQHFIQKVNVKAALNQHHVCRDVQILEPGLWVADVFGWSQEFLLLKQLSEYATVIIDGYTSSQLRSLQLTSQSLPYTTQDSVVVISPVGEISRATL